MTKSLFAASLLATSALTLAAPAHAQRIDRIVAFGDSYADDGNLFQLLGIAPPSAYGTGRFSGGSNYIDTLGQILGVPIDNFAIGGAFTGPGNTGFFNINGPGIPGFPTEYQSFLAGGGPAAFPRVSGRFGPNDLLAISIGGNDARYYEKLAGATVAGAGPRATISVAEAKVGLDALVGAGARNISFLAGDVGRLPEVTGDPRAPIGSAYATAFNSGIQPVLAGYASNGVIVHYLDLNRVGDNIIANPTAYGLTSGGACPAAQATQCVTDAAFNGQYLFYVDGVHLSSAGFAIVARYIDAQLTAPLTLQASSDLGLDVARQFGRTLTTRMDLGSPRDGDMPEGLHAFVVGDTVTRRQGAGDRNVSYRATSVGGTAGLEYGFGSGVIGLAANYSKPRASFSSDAADIDGRSVQIGGYAGFGLAGIFAQAYAGYGKDKHEIERTGVVQDMEANPKGRHTLAGAKAGYLIPLGTLRVGPVVGLDYAKAKVNGYTESGDAALTLNVSSLSYSSLRGSAGVELRGDFGGGGVQLRPYAAAVIEKDFTGAGRTVRFAQTSAPTIVNHFAFDDASKKAYGRFSAGFSAAILTGVSLDVAGSATVGKDQGEETSAHVGLRMGF
ncbi:MAG: autotransporter domain-containing protein [Sphingomonas sp.]|uniref:autotransporter domain-containing protein n=1 Tax=Sphingomonas sp. TaxID=28214 RepID=UPI0017C8177B|nr:autotransporter domain-containing protein [Sphingomonas sp.]MBA3666760.1 autotransporter domain-containing protein [Sphingomonas sp.]